MTDKKKYTLKPNKIQLLSMKDAWKQLQSDTDHYFNLVQATERWMSKSTGIKDIEFIHSDGEIIGIGNASRTMKLYQREELER